LLRTRLPAAETLPAFWRQLQETDLQAIEDFFERGPRRNRSLKAQHGIQERLIAPVRLDDLLVTALPSDRIAHVSPKPDSAASKAEIALNPGIAHPLNAPSVAERDRMSTATIRDIGQIAVVVGDVAQAKRFYVDVLGLKHLFDAGPNLAFVAAGSVRIMLTTPQGAGEVGKNSTLYFRTDALDRLFAAVVERGAKPERPPQLTAKLPDHELWIGFLRDPDNNLVGLMEERR
jgi:predicted enzyme related to lactoylglutathione lyase